MTLTPNIVTFGTRPGRIEPALAQWFMEHERAHS